MEPVVEPLAPPFILMAKSLAVLETASNSCPLLLIADLLAALRLLLLTFTSPEARAVKASKAAEEELRLLAAVTEESELSLGRFF